LRNAPELSGIRDSGWATMLETLVYVSAAGRPFSASDLAALLQASRARNAATGITGLLLHVGGNFMQAIEGEPRAVTALYDRIAQDPRHHGLKTILRLPIARRLFRDWSMGFQEAAELPPESRAEISAFIDEVARRDADPALIAGEPPAMRLLSGFAATMR
jgi:hypothetical protein